MKQELVLKEKLPEGWKSLPYNKCVIKSPERKIKKFKVTEYQKIGKFPIIDQGKDFIAGYTNEENDIIDLKQPVIIFGDHTLSIKYVDFPFARGADGTQIIIPNTNEVFPRFFYYYLKSLNIEVKNYERYFKYVKKRNFVLPPLLVQQQIISKLDAQMVQIEIMKKEAEKGERASGIFSESILKSVFNNPTYKKDKIKNLCSINPRKSELKYSDETATSFVPMEAVNQYKGIIGLPQFKPFGKIKKGYTYFEENDVLFAKITPCMQNKKSAIAKNLINGFGFGTTEFHVLRANSKILPELLLYYVREGSFIEEAKLHFTGAVGQQRVPKEFIEEYEILYPGSKEEQIQLLKKIEKSNDEIHKINEILNQKILAISQLPSSLLNEVFGKYEIHGVN